MKNFIEEFKQFKELIKDQKMKDEDIITLYAIYRKDLRGEAVSRVREPKLESKTITEKQKKYILSLCTKLKSDIPDNLEQMTSREAFLLIQNLKETLEKGL